MNVSRRIPIRRPSPALVVACIALLVALSGTGYAAVALPRDSVGTVHLKAGAVTSPKVRDGSLSTRDLSPAARRALSGRPGPEGPPGPKGDKGDRGEPGPAGISGWEMVTATNSSGSSSPRTMTVTCPTGKRLLGGGAAAFRRFADRVPEGIALTESLPIGDSWIASARELTPTDQDWILQVTAICANVQ